MAFYVFGYGECPPANGAFAITQSLLPDLDLIACRDTHRSILFFEAIKQLLGGADQFAQSSA